MLEFGVQTIQTPSKLCGLKRLCRSRSRWDWLGSNVSVMETEIIPESHDLANKPLVEALFELRWKLDENQARGTTAFRLLFGRYYDRIRATYPEVEDLPASAVPESMTPYIVRHRFRTAKDQWPVTQIGPGIMSVNETEKYRWEPFRKRIEETSQAIFDGFPREMSPFEPTQAELRYINMIPYEVWNGGITEFIAKNLHTTIKLDDRLFNGPPKTGNERGLDFSISYRLTKPQATGTLSFATGANEDKTGILWQLIIRSYPGHVPDTHEKIMSWSDEAHDVVDSWFFTLARGSLMETFDRETP